MKKNTNEKGQGFVEYMLILLLGAICIIVLFSFIGPALQKVFDQIGEQSTELSVGTYCPEGTEDCDGSESQLVVVYSPLVDGNLACLDTVSLNGAELNLYWCHKGNYDGKGD